MANLGVDGSVIHPGDGAVAQLVRHRRAVILAVHLALLAFAHWLAVNLRFDFDIPQSFSGPAHIALVVAITTRMVTFGSLGLFRGWWRHAGVDDLLGIVRAVTYSSGILIAVLFGMGLLPSFSRSILFLDWLLACVVMCGARLCTRVTREVVVGQRRFAGGTPTLILGAGIAAEQLLRHLRYDGGSEILPVGMLDDDPEKHGMRLHGVPVLGPTQDLPRYASELGVDLIVISIPSAGRTHLQRLVDLCMKSGIRFKIVPSLRELLNGEFRIGQIRSVEIDDLLGRPAIDLDLTQVADDIAGRTVLITGGAGSIGSELARQIAKFDPARLILLEQAESNLYFIHLEFAEHRPRLDVIPIIGDIADGRRMNQIFARHRPDYVFHAAAYKHVPMMESNIDEAVRNNVLGTLTVAECSARYGVRKFVMISTDKAVRPTSVMGATKRIAERIVLAWPPLRHSATEFRVVRFGNVLGSDGSVIPLFKRQIASGAPVTVTHPEATRYFMTIPEAVQLVVQAAALVEVAGRISILNMGEPVRILDLAENLIRLSGLEPYKDVPIVFSGLRPGEKLHEELTYGLEVTVPTRHQDVRVIEAGETGDGLATNIGRLEVALNEGDPDRLLAIIRELVPEYRGQVVKLPLRIEGSFSERDTAAEQLSASALPT